MPNETEHTSPRLRSELRELVAWREEVERDVSREEALPRRLLLCSPEDASRAGDRADDLVEDVVEDARGVLARHARAVVHKVVALAGELFFVERQDVAGPLVSRLDKGLWREGTHLA